MGIIDEVGRDVTTIKPGQFVVGSFFASDNTCEICRAGYQSSPLSEHTESTTSRRRPRHAIAPPPATSMDTMDTVTLNNGVEMPVLGFGVFQVPREDTEKVVADALATGYQHIDTAAVMWVEVV